MLKFNGAWRFHPPASVDSTVISEFLGLIGKVVAQGDRHEILEHFKHYFAGAAGMTSSWSSSASWAETDLYTYMSEAAKNAPLFIAAFCDACEALREKNPEFYTPEAPLINRLLIEHGIEFELRPPDLVARGALAVAIFVPAELPSLDEQAQDLIQQSLLQSEQFLSEGRDRQAVQEILWLVETVSTAFQGLQTDAGTVQGKYFNKIADKTEDRRGDEEGFSEFDEEDQGWDTGPLEQ